MRGNTCTIYLHHFWSFYSIQAEESNRIRNLQCKIIAASVLLITVLLQSLQLSYPGRGSKKLRRLLFHIQAFWRAEIFLFFCKLLLSICSQVIGSLFLHFPTLENGLEELIVNGGPRTLHDMAPLMSVDLLWFTLRSGSILFLSWRHYDFVSFHSALSLLLNSTTRF